MKIFQHSFCSIRFFRSPIYLAICAAVMLNSCAKPPKLPDILQPVGAEFAKMTTEEVSQAIVERTEHFQSLSGLGKVQIENWEERYKFTQAFVVEKPERFRLEILGPFDQPAIFFTSDAQMLSLYAKKQNIEYRGVASRENLFKLGGVNLSVEDFLLALSGNPPKLDGVTSEWGAAIQEGQYHYLERISFKKNIVQRIWYDTQYRMVSQVQEYMLTNGEMLLNVRFANYRGEQGGYPLPAIIDIERPMDKVRVHIEYQEMDVNQSIDATLFTFTPPTGANVVHIDDTTNQDLGRLAPFEEFRVQRSEQTEGEQSDSQK
ncbi:hypothetical protein U14_03049 [Candidatus Moduliflexus flocculans]|uniref:Outer membrane lipoprotein-sorting protein n=1 Tax=Candidatus Moduliflexus flocculans TaxID=1499966 RepID=A0A081BN37_9BACT|nr:hypothetical protein U14_03049 [Candidatus Moduliflexus flocculans]